MDLCCVCQFIPHLPSDVGQLHLSRDYGLEMVSVGSPFLLGDDITINTAVCLAGSLLGWFPSLPFYVFVCVCAFFSSRFDDLKIMRWLSAVPRSSVLVY